MAGGLMETGDFYRSSGVNMIGAASELEEKRKAENERLEQADKAGTISAVAAGAAIGTMVMPGVGTAIGAGVGLLADALLD